MSVVSELVTVTPSKNFCMLTVIWVFLVPPVAMLFAVSVAVPAPDVLPDSIPEGNPALSTPAAASGSEISSFAFCFACSEARNP